MNKAFAALAVLLVVVGMAVAQATLTGNAPPPLITNFPSWEVASEFNDATNPSSVWTYCSKVLVSSTNCTLMTAPFVSLWGTQVKGWTAPAGAPLIVHNVNPVAITGPIGYPYPVTIPPHSLVLHPGPNGEYAVLRFTAPLAGSYRISGQFWAADDNSTATTTDVWVVLNNNTVPPVYSGSLDYLSGARFASFSCKTITLRPGDTLDFQVGYGSNGSYYFDSTGLNAVIEKIK